MPTMSGQMDHLSAALGVHIANELETLHKAKHDGLALLPLIDRQKAKLVEAKVATGSFHLPILARSLATNAGEAIQDVLGTAASAGAIGYVSSVMLNEQGNTQGHIFQAAAGTLTPVLTLLIRSTVNTLAYKSTTDDLNAEIETYKNLKKNTNLETYPDDIQKAVKLLDDDIENAIKSPRGPGAVWFQQKIRHRELVLLARPTEVKRFANFADPQATIKFYSDVDKIVSEYPKQNQATIKVLVQRIAANSQGNGEVRSQAYLQGPGGVGKTRLVHRIAKVLGAPLVELNINGKSIRELKGLHYSVNFTEPTKPDEEVIGELPLKMIAAGYVNPIVFIDEMKLTHDNVNELKLLLDPNNKKLKIGGYEANIDWSRATILVGSNDPLTVEALQTRMQQIIIREVSQEAKFKVANDVINEIAGAEVYKKSLTPELHKRLLSTCRTRLDQIIEFDTDNFPGVRFLEASTENMVHFVAAGLLEGKPKDMDELRDYLEIQYAQAKGRPTPGDVVPPPTALAGNQTSDWE